MPLTTIVGKSETSVISLGKLTTVSRATTKINTTSQSQGFNLGRIRLLRLSPAKALVSFSVKHILNRQRINPQIEVLSLTSATSIICLPVPIAPTGSLSLNGNPLNRQRIPKGDSCFIEFSILGRRLGGMQIKFLLLTLKGETLLEKKIGEGVLLLENLSPVIDIDSIAGTIAITHDETILSSLPKECEVRYSFKVTNKSHAYTLETGYLNFFL